MAAQWNLGWFDAGTNTYQLGWWGEPAVAAITYPYTWPEGLVDTKSLPSGIKLPSGTTFRFTQDPSVGVIDKTAGQNQIPPWSSDINDIYQPPGGFTGTVTIGLEAKEADGTLSAFTVTLTIEAGVVTDVRWISRPGFRRGVGNGNAVGTSGVAAQ